MKFSQSIIITFLGALIATTAASKESYSCTLNFDNASLKTHSNSVRIHGSSEHMCASTSVVTVSTKKALAIKDKDGKIHQGTQCTFTLNKSYSHLSDSKKQVSLPFSHIKSITCNGDKSQIKKRSKHNNKKGHKKNHHTKKGKTTTKKKTTTTKKKTTTTKKKTTTTKKKTTTTKKKTTTTKKTTTKKTTTTVKNASSSGYRSGTVTFFTPNTGACGKKNSSKDMIVALGGSYYGSYSKKSSYCGRQIYIETADGKKSVTVTVADACESCAKDHLDLSPAAFAKLGSFNTGVLKIKYKFIS